MLYSLLGYIASLIYSILLYSSYFMLYHDSTCLQQVLYSSLLYSTSISYIAMLIAGVKAIQHQRKLYSMTEGSRCRAKFTSLRQVTKLRRNESLTIFNLSERHFNGFRVRKLSNNRTRTPLATCQAHLLRTGTGRVGTGPHLDHRKRNIGQVHGRHELRTRSLVYCTLCACPRLRAWARSSYHQCQ